MTKQSLSTTDRWGGEAAAGVGQNRYDDPKVLARLAALKEAPIADLKQQWRDLFETEPPPYNRAFLESRLAYRIQELAFGGLKQQTLARLRALAADLDRASGGGRQRRADDLPIAGCQSARKVDP